MDSLNLKELNRKIKIRNEELAKKGAPRDTAYLDHRKIDDEEVDGVSGDRISVESNIWNQKIYYKKTIIKNNEPIVIKIFYNEDCKVTGIYKIYSEEYLEKNPRPIRYSVGKSYSYDKNGDVIKIIDYDSLHVFTIEDVFKFLKRNDMKSFKSIYEIGNAPTLEWEIWYQSGKFGYCQARIDARTGKILDDSKNIKRGQE